MNDPGGFHRCDHLQPKLLIAIKDQVFVRGFKGKRLAQLLDDPTARRMLRDVTSGAERFRSSPVGGSDRGSTKDVEATLYLASRFAT